MRSLASDIAYLFTGHTAGAEPRTLIEIAASGGTKYYSDQHVEVGAQVYDARVLRLGRLQLETKPSLKTVLATEIPIKLSNHDPDIGTDIDPGDVVTIYIWDEGAASGSKFKVFVGTVNDNIRMDLYEFSFTCTDVSATYDKLVGEKLDVATYPNADPKDIGRVQPIPFGSVTNSRCLAIEAGAATTLTVNMSNTFTGAVSVADADKPIAFPSSGFVFIGEEKLAYSATTTTTITISARAQSGTTASTHSRGDKILEAVATVKYMASGLEVKTLSNAAIVPWNMPVENKVSVDSFATYKEDDSGIATIELNSLPEIAKKVALVVDPQPDQPVTDDGTHVHVATVNDAAEVTIYGSGVDSSQNASNTGRAFDQNFDTTESTLSYTSPSSAHLGLDFDFTGFDGLVIQQAVACIRVSVDVSSNIAKLRLPGVSFGLLNQDLTIGGGVATQKFIVTGLANETDWSKLNTLRILVSGPGGPLTTRVYQMWWEIKYIPTVTITTHAADGISTSPRTTDAGIKGDSVAASLGGYLICDIDGIPDVAGHWTGSGTDLIEKPVDIFHWILENLTNGPVAHADIDLAGSFANAESNHLNMDKWGFVITQQIMVNELLTYLAQQFFCRFVYEAGVAKLNRIKLSASSAKSVDTNWDSITQNDKLAVVEDRWGPQQVWNDVTVNYDLDLTGGQGNWFAEESYDQHTQDENAASITANGRQTKVLSAFAIRDNTTYADDLRDKWLAYWKDNKKYISFPAWSTLIALERGDMVDITTSQLGLSSFDCEVVDVALDFPVPNAGRPLKPIITALEI